MILVYDMDQKAATYTVITLSSIQALLQQEGRHIMGKKALKPAPAALAVVYDPAVLFGILTFCKLAMHNVFLVHNCIVFLRCYKIGQGWFYWSQLVFMIWNSINDPLFGWISDKHNIVARDGSSSSSQSTTNMREKRVRTLSRAGVFLAITFGFFWMKLPYPGIQFLISLCVYDTFLTLVDLHLHAMLVEYTISSRNRARFSLYASIFSMAASGSVGVSHKSAPQTSFRDFITVISKNPNFRWMNIVNVLQCFHCHFNSSMFPVFIALLLGDKISKFWTCILVMLSFLMPHINNWLLLQWVPIFGLHKIILVLLLLKLTSSAIMLWLGENFTYCVAGFLALNRIYTEGVCKLIDLSISDLADEDFVLNKRRHPIPALIYGAFALLSRVSQSLAPSSNLIIVTIWMRSKDDGCL
eukprot:jgi/Bigna1/83799/fgenesh1_pg.115_\